MEIMLPTLSPSFLSSSINTPVPCEPPRVGAGLFLRAANSLSAGGAEIQRDSLSKMFSERQNKGQFVLFFLSPLPFDLAQTLWPLFLKSQEAA